MTSKSVVDEFVSQKKLAILEHILFAAMLITGGICFKNPGNILYQKTTKEG